MKIFCIGRNYVDHAKELDNPIPEKPIWFIKPDTCLIHKNRPFFFPEYSQDIHFEVELVVRINKIGKYIQEKFAHTYYDEIGIGLDFTARDLQMIAKEKGLPWSEAKCFEGSAPLGEFVPKSKFDDVQNIDFRLEKNGEIVQQSNSKEMIFKIDQLIAYLSQFATLKIGDLIFTGTPKGVGPVQPEDVLEAYIGEEKLLRTVVK